MLPTVVRIVLVAAFVLSPEIVPVLHAPPEGGIDLVVFSSDGELAALAAGSPSRLEIRCRSHPQARLALSPPPHHSGHIRQMQFLCGAQQLITVGADVLIWNISTGIAKWRRDLIIESLYPVSDDNSTSPNIMFAPFLTGKSSSIVRRDLSNKTPPRESDIELKIIKSASYSPKGKVIAVCGTPCFKGMRPGPAGMMLDADTNSVLWSIDGMVGHVSHFLVAPCSSKAAYCRQSKENDIITVADARSGRMIGNPCSIDFPLRHMTWSSDSRMLAALGKNGRIVIIETLTGFRPGC